MDVRMLPEKRVPCLMERLPPRRATWEPTKHFTSPNGLHGLICPDQPAAASL